jgi:hypothetical protein
LDADVAERLGEQRPGPAREPFGRRLVQQPQNALVGCLRVDRFLARSRLVRQAFKAEICKTMAPQADDPWLDADLLGIERVLRPAADSRTIRARFKSRCNITGDRQRASSTLRSFRDKRTSLASGIIPTLNHDSHSCDSGT